jgi:hypothetical protein
MAKTEPKKTVKPEKKAETKKTPPTPPTVPTQKPVVYVVKQFVARIPIGAFEECGRYDSEEEVKKVCHALYLRGIRSEVVKI